MPTHSACGSTWVGFRAEHCPACHLTFNSGYAADAHRVGDWSSVNPRRCLTPDEMLDRGMGVNARGLWVSGARDPDSWPDKADPDPD